jgi:hypothetical protein
LGVVVEGKKRDRPLRGLGRGEIALLAGEMEATKAEGRSCLGVIAHGIGMWRG